MGLLNRLKQRPNKQHPQLSLHHTPGHRSGHGSSLSRSAQVLLLVAAGVLLNILILWPALHSHNEGLGSSSLHGSARLILSTNYLDDFDGDSDGLLSSPEFKSVIGEVCAVDAEGLSLLRRIQRTVALLLLEGGSPCRSARMLLVGGSLPPPPEGLQLTSAEDGEAPPADRPEMTAEQKRQKLMSCGPLDGSLLAAAESQRTIILTAADWSMFDLFGVNWLTHVRKAGITNYLMAALDQRTADFLTTNKLGHCLLWDASSTGSSSSSSDSLGGSGSSPGSILPPLPTQAARYDPGSEAFKVVTWARLAAAHAVLQRGYHVLLTDLDTVWFRNPVPYIRQHAAAADLVVASSAPLSSNRQGDAGLEVGAANAAVAGWLSLGVVFVRSNEVASATLQGLFTRRDALLAAAAAAAANISRISSSSSSRAGTPPSPVPLPDPQQLLVQWVQRPGVLLPRAAPNPADAASTSRSAAAEAAARLLRVWVGKGAPPSSSGRWWFNRRHPRKGELVQVGVLSPRVLANTYSNFVWRGASPVSPVVLGGGGAPVVAGDATALLGAHMEGAGSGKELRLHSLREATWYADGPRYYSDPKLFSIQLDPYVPPTTYDPVTADEEAQVQLHAAALLHQLSQLYVGMALSALLGRVFVLPPLQCYCWNSGGSGRPQFNCRAAGDYVSALPFTCTLDQLLRPEVLYAHQPLFGGRRLQFREHSFGDNPRTPSWIPHARTELLPGSPRCTIDSPGGLCRQVLGSRPERDINQQVVLPQSLTDTQLADLLTPYTSAKWLHAWNVTLLWRGFADPQHKQQYEAWLDGLVVPWCCRGSKLPVQLRQEPFRIRASVKEALRAIQEDPTPAPTPAAAGGAAAGAAAGSATAAAAAPGAAAAGGQAAAGAAASASAPAAAETAGGQATAAASGTEAPAAAAAGGAAGAADAQGHKRGVLEVDAPGPVDQQATQAAPEAAAAAAPATAAAAVTPVLHTTAEAAAAAAAPTTAAPAAAGTPLLHTTAEAAAAAPTAAAVTPLLHTTADAAAAAAAVGATPLGVGSLAEQAQAVAQPGAVMPVSESSELPRTAGPGMAAAAAAAAAVPQQ